LAAIGALVEAAICGSAGAVIALDTVVHIPAFQIVWPGCTAADMVGVVVGAWAGR